MNKLIILTTSIIRGDFHSRSVGKFYEYFNKHLEKYDIYHIINIDEPENLKKYFNKYETMGVYNKIIPEKVNKVFINEPNPGFLQAYKKIVSKIEELGLIDDLYLYLWLEDDWEPKNQYDITKFFDLFKFTNTAYTFTDRSPLGSFRGGPFMTGSYFKNIFNIRKYMNDTCDPERQMQRWLRGGYQKNGNLSIHRFSFQNSNIDNTTINIIILCDKNKIEIGDLNKHHYNSGFDKSINFIFHLIVYDEQFNLKYSKIDEKNYYNLLDIDINELETIFGDNSIKYFIIKPSIMFDIGREFNTEYGLKKWMKIEDNTGYSNVQFYNAYLGNWKIMKENELRLKPEYTMNEGFFNALAYIHQCLPYLEINYFNANIKLNIQYISHLYGSYPNFNVIGDLIELNYIPSINNSNFQYEKLNCLKTLFENISNSKIENEEFFNTNIYQDNFILANKYFFKYFKFNDEIMNNTNIFIKNFANKKVLGIDFRTDYEFDDKSLKTNHFNQMNNYDFDITKFIDIIDNKLEKNKYDIIFLSSDDFEFINIIKKKYSLFYQILTWDNFNDESNFKNINRLKLIENIIKQLIEEQNDVEKIIILESELKKVINTNKSILQNFIINSLILSKCNIVIKTESQLSAYSKVFNPDLEIYKINSDINVNWPNSHIELFKFENLK